jgi:putative transposase
MARLPRLYVEGCSHHVIQRGNNRQACFFADEDYAIYVDKLREASEKYQVDVHAFVLMTNHVHLLVTPIDELGIARMMQSVGRFYVRYVNTTYRRTGTLWGRFLLLQNLHLLRPCNSRVVINQRWLIAIDIF